MLNLAGQLPIGSLTSQFFANVYMNELDQYAKHQLRIGGYIRYVDDIILLGPDVATLMAWKAQIECFLRERLALTLHPRKTVIQRCKARGPIFSGPLCIPGTDLVGNAPCAHCGGASVGSTNCLGRHRIYHLPSLVTGTVGWLTTPCCLTVRPAWLYCSAYWRHSIAIMVSSVMPTPGNYANTCIIMNLENCAAIFLPDGPGYHHLRIRKAWLPSHISKPHSKASLGLGGLYKQ